MLLKCVPHVQHDYFSSFNQSDHCFLVLSLPLPSSLLKLPISCCHRHSTKRKSGEREKAEAPFVLNMSITANYGCFSLDVISAPTNKEKAPLAIWLYYHAKREPSFAIVLCTNMAVRLTTWLESTYWLTSLPCYTLSNRQGVRGISGGRFFSSYMWIFDQISNYCPMSETIKERFNWCQGQTSDPRFIFDKG